MTRMESEKIDRLENHFKVYKEDTNELIKRFNNIEIALIGSNLNGHKGIVHLLDSVDKRLQGLEDKQILADDRLESFKWFQRGLLGIIFSYLTWLISK